MNTKIYHNNTLYLIDLPKIKYNSNYIKILFRIPLEYYEIFDNYSEIEFSLFLNILIGNEYLIPEPKTLNKIIKLSQDWNIPEIEKEIEKKILNSKDYKYIFSFIKDLPNYFEGIYYFISIYIKDFEEIVKSKEFTLNHFKKIF